MTVEIRRAQRTNAKLRLGLAGPSGAGKTMSSLKLAKGITPAGRILMIDTERGSGDLYADLSITTSSRSSRRISRRSTSRPLSQPS